MEDACRERRVGTAERQHVGNVPHRSCAARGDEGDGQLGQPCEGLARVAVARAVVIHRGEEQLARAPLTDFVRPCEKFAVGHALAAVGRDAPYAVGHPRVDGRDDELRPVFRRDGVDQRRVAYGGAVDGDLVRPGVEQPPGVGDRCDASAHGERDVDAFGDSGDQLREGLPPLFRGADVEVYQFVGPFGGVFRPQLHRVADVAQPDEVDALDGLSLADVEAGDYAFGKHLFSSSRVIRPS